MGSETDFKCQQMRTPGRPHVLQAERLRIAAENKLGHEARRTDIRLPRLLVHITILDSLAELDISRSPSRLPSYSQATRAVNVDTRPTPSDSHDVPELDEDSHDLSESSDEEEEWWDCEDDDDHTLVRTQSHPPGFIHEHNDFDDQKTRSIANQSEKLMTIANARHAETMVLASVVEAAEYED